MSGLERAPDTRLYVGRRLMRGEVGVGVVVVKRDDDGADQPLPVRLDLVNHSPDGFEWAYAGSGPAQLACALLADCEGDAVALAFYQRFKFATVVDLEVEGWALTAAQIRQRLEAIRADAEAGQRQ